MCSPQYLPFLNPACSLRSIGSRAVDILFRITLLNTLLVMDSIYNKLIYYFKNCESFLELNQFSNVYFL